MTPPRGFVQPLRRWVYPGILLLVFSVWLVYMNHGQRWGLFADYWTISLMMAVGSILGALTSEGGGFISFPILTKVLGIPTADARTFGLMIQSFGMTMAGLVIWLKRIEVLPKVIGWVSLGGIFGQILGTFALPLPEPYPKLVFTFIAGLFGVALVISRWGLNHKPRQVVHQWGGGHRSVFLLVGICGGILAAHTGSGINLLTFILLTLAFAIDERITTPTAVIIMGINSVVGFVLHGAVVGDIGIVWDYWLVAMPIVIVGAPLGSLAASRMKRDHIIMILIAIIALELLTTVILVPIHASHWAVLGITALICAGWFSAMLKYRIRRLRKVPHFATSSEG